ncbi:MAG: VCBS repeat-containing protein, partial [Cytophagales bacterium]|nr:VCBS repeat-containing protein [Cytophagales bacterium]
TSLTAMGNEVGDVNNDGLADIVALDMLPKNTERKKQLAPPNNYQTYINSDQFGYTYQYMRNTLQLNSGNQADGTSKPFHEISLMAGISESEWSWCPSLADFDNDGYRDLFVTNGYPRDVTDRDFMLYRANTLQLSSSALMLEQVPVIKISNYAYRNRGDLTFEDVTEKWGLSIPSFSNGAAYGDLDNDGDLDYIVNNINDKAFLYRNNSREEQADRSHYLRIKFKGDQKNLQGFGAKIEGVFENGERFYYENTPYRGYLSSVEPVAHIGLGTKRKLKEIHIVWPNDKMQVIKKPGVDQILTVSMDAAKEPYQTLFEANKPLLKDISEELNLVDVHQEYDFIDFNYQNLMPFKLSQLGPGLSAGDVNGDGLEDFFQGGAKFYSGIFYIQNQAGQFNAKPLEKSISVPKKLGEDLGSLLIDFDQDGDLDLYIARGGNEDKLGAASFQDVIYVNDGKGNFTLDALSLPIFTESNAAVRASDFDHDGDLDLFVGGRNVPFQYPKSTTSRLLKNESVKGHIKFVDVTQTLAKDLIDVGLICDGIWSDYDLDGWQDIILAGEFSDIKILKNDRGRFTLLKATGLEELSGIWTSLSSGDFDHDGDMDYVAGNMGKNTLLRANSKQPVDIWHGDLDGNGVYDLFPFVYFQTADGKMASASLFGKDDVHKMLNQTRQRWVYYKDFGKVTQENFFLATEKEKAKKISMQENSSIWIENVGDGKFKAHTLPMMAQISAMNGIQVRDINQDGHLDIMYVGNNYANEVFMGRYDASNGGVLLGNGKGKFTYLDQSGLFVPKDAKSLISIDLGKKGLAFIASQNRGKMHAFTSLGNTWTRMNIPKGIQGFEYQFKGLKQRVEWTYGSSYLGQSANGQAFLPAGAKLIKTF